jgi:hypothetical protein
MEVTASLADDAIGVMRRVGARLEPVTLVKKHLRGGVGIKGGDGGGSRHDEVALAGTGGNPRTRAADASAELLRARCADLHHRHLCSDVSMCRRRSELRAAGGASRKTVTDRTESSIDEPPEAAARHHPPASALQVARPETVRTAGVSLNGCPDPVDVVEPTRDQLPAFHARAGGHECYRVVTEHRCNSYATETPHLSLIRSRAVGTERVLVTCDRGDGGSTDESRRTARIGRFPSSPTPRTRRYWIDGARNTRRMPLWSGFVAAGGRRFDWRVSCSPALALLGAATPVAVAWWRRGRRAPRGSPWLPFGHVGPIPVKRARTVIGGAPARPRRARGVLHSWGRPRPALRAAASIGQLDRRREHLHTAPVVGRSLVRPETSPLDADRFAAGDVRRSPQGVGQRAADRRQPRSEQVCCAVVCVANVADASMLAQWGLEQSPTRPWRGHQRAGRDVIRCTAGCVDDRQPEDPVVTGARQRLLDLC